MKLLFIALLSALSYRSCSGYPVVEDEFSEDPLESTSIEYGLDTSNETASNDSLPLHIKGIGLKIVNKVKEGIKTVKDKVKGGFDKVKEKVKGGFDIVKDKIKDKIGSQGDGSGGGYYRDNYDRDRYNRENYRKDGSYGSGSVFSDPDAKWIGLGIGIFMLVGILGVIICFVCKIEKD